MSKAKKIMDGINFPITNQSTGDRSSSDVGKKVWSSAIEPVDAELAAKIRNEKNWRHGYHKHVIKNVQTSLKNPKAAVTIAESGLNALHNTMEFIREGKTYTLADAMKNITNQPYHTAKVEGKLRSESQDFVVPYKGRNLTRQALVEQLEQWEKYGTIEADTATAIAKVANNPAWCDLSDKYFVLLGAGSAMGPFLTLMALGANVIAVDLDRPHIWKRLINVARESRGTLTFATKKPQDQCTSDEELFENAGCNLISSTPEINNWLVNLLPNTDLVCGCYVYLDGEAHVRVALACDAIMKGLTERRKNVSLAFLCTPTDCHVITEESNKAAFDNYNSFSWQNMILRVLRVFQGPAFLANNALKAVPSDAGDNFYIVDGVVVPQGPNYILAKRMQHWRAVLSRSRGCTVSTNIAPSTATASVVSNRSFAWAYDGMPFFRPMEIFSQETSNAVMAALLIHDLREPSSAAHPEVQLKNPMELFKYTSFHGGIWRSGYKVGSMGEVSVIVHFVKVLRPVIFALSVLSLGYYLYNAQN